MIERADHHVIDEPFSAVYYLGPDRVSDRYPLTEPEATAATVTEAVETAPTPLFVKDMVHHVPMDRRERVAALGHHTLLTRDPARAIPSFAHVWPDVTWEECGYETLAEFADLLDAAGHPYDVIDAADLQRAPEPTLRAWCARHHLDFDPATLRWEPGVVEQWNRWLEFHASAIASGGFTAREPSDPPVVTDGRIAELVERATPLHQRLLARAATS